MFLNSNVEQALKDKKWEEAQIQVFSHWVRSLLPEREIHDILEDFSDGVTIVKFVEVLTDKPIKYRYQEKPTFKIHKIENTHLALGHIKSVISELRLEIIVTASSENFVNDKNLTELLGFLWILFRQFNIQVTMGSHGKGGEDPMILWVREVTEGYKGVNVTGWDSFNDGLAFLALADSFSKQYGLEGDYFDFEDRVDNHAPIDNVKFALDVISDKLGIPSILEPELLVKGEEEDRTIVLYVSSLFQTFYNAKVKKEKNHEYALELEKAQALVREKVSLAESLAQEELLKLQTQLQQFQADIERETKIIDEEIEDANDELALSLEETKRIQALVAIEEEENRRAKAELDDYYKEQEAKVEGITHEITDIQGMIDAKKAEITRLEEELKLRKQQELDTWDSLKNTLKKHLRDLSEWKEPEENYPSDRFAKKMGGALQNLSAEDQIDFMRKTAEAENASLAKMWESLHGK